jgi:hypothetical protein
MLDRRQLGMQIRRRRLCHFIAASRRSLWITHNSEHIIEWQFTTGLSRLNQDASALVTRALRAASHRHRSGIAVGSFPAYKGRHQRENTPFNKTMA